MDPGMKSQLQTSVQRYFLEFLCAFKLPKEGGGYHDDCYYVEQAKAMLRLKKRTLYVKISHLELIDAKEVSYEPADLRSVLESKYLMVKDNLNAAVPELLRKIADPDLQELAKQHLAETGESKFAAAFYDLPLFHGIRDLRAEQLNKLVTIRGTVTRTTEVKPELLVGTFQCNECQREVSGVVQQFKITHPAVCPTRNCGNRTNWELLPEASTTRWGDWQRVRLQENENEVKAGNMPRSLDVIVRDECCERCKPGDKVMVTGCLIVVPDVPSLMNPSELKKSEKRSLNTRSDSGYGGSDGVRGLKGLGNRDLTYKMAFYGGFVEEDSEWGSHGDGAQVENVRSDEAVHLSPSDKEKFRAISEHLGAGGKRDCFDVVARAIAPAVQGHLDVKKGILLMLIGGVAKKTEEGIKLRGDLNVCLLGDPATAKSALLKWVSGFLPRAVFTSGKTSTAAGLTASVVKDMDLDGEKVIEPGALMLADNGICCIDEFEQMDQKDQVAIHEAMEQQTITLSKAGIQATLNARTSILAACLPKNTYYQPTLPLHKNIDLSPPIMSRFDLMFVIQDIHDPTTDNKVAEHILSLHRRKEQASTSSLMQIDLQRYIRTARLITPKVSPQAAEALVKCYKKLREDRHGGFVRGSAGVTVRQLESLLRLSEGVARVHLDEIVRSEYVTMAFELQLNSLRRAERENIDLAPEVADDADVADAPAEANEEGVQTGAPARPRRMKITYAEYQRIGQLLATHLARQEENREVVQEQDLIAWYMEQVEEDIHTEAELFEAQHLVQLIINRLIDKDRVILVYQPSEDPMKPEQRVLVKHPNFPVGDPIYSTDAARRT